MSHKYFLFLLVPSLFCHKNDSKFLVVSSTMLLFWYINFCECKRHWFPITGHIFIVVINIRNVDISGTFFVKLRKKNTIVKWVAFGDTACCHQVREWVKLLSYLNEKSNNYRYLKWINKLFMYFKVWRRQIKFYNMPPAKRKYIYIDK